MSPEEIYKDNIDHSHEAALGAVYAAGYAQGVADGVETAQKAAAEAAAVQKAPPQPAKTVPLQAQGL